MSQPGLTGRCGSMAVFFINIISGEAQFELEYGTVAIDVLIVRRQPNRIAALYLNMLSFAVSRYTSGCWRSHAISCLGLDVEALPGDSLSSSLRAIGARWAALYDLRPVRLSREQHHPQPWTILPDDRANGDLLRLDVDKRFSFHLLPVEEEPPCLRL